MLSIGHIWCFRGRAFSVNLREQGQQNGQSSIQHSKLYYQHIVYIYWSFDEFIISRQIAAFSRYMTVMKGSEIKKVETRLFALLCSDLPNVLHHALLKDRAGLDRV